MRALVVYESIYGNTQAVARAVAEGLSSQMDVEAVEVGLAPAEPDQDVGLLVVGGPTHAFGMSRPSTRQDAATTAAPGTVSARIGQREWLASLPRGSAGLAAAAFDTRVNSPRVPGSAARGAQRRLRRLGVRLLAPAQSFHVTGRSGPLVPGELERARRWGEKLGVDFLASGPHEPPTRR